MPSVNRKTRLPSEVVPVVVGPNPRQHLIVQRLSLLLGIVVQIAAVVQIVQASCRLWRRCHSSRRRSISQIVDHIRGAETTTATNGSIVERLLLLLQIRIIVATCAVLIYKVVRMQRYVVVVQLVVKLLLVDGIVSGVNVNMSEIAIATVATAAASGVIIST